MRELPVRLTPGVDLRAAVVALAREQLPQGAFIVCGIGSLIHPRLRLAGQGVETQYVGPYEILTLSGTATVDGAHLHASLSSASGEVVGGHVVAGNEILTTVELLLVEPSGFTLGRAFDAATGFTELVVERRKP